jgi:hypothetical protein
MQLASLTKLAAAATLIHFTGCRSFLQNPLANAFHIPVNVKSGAAYPLPKVPAWSLKHRGFSKADLLPDPDSLYVFHYSREQSADDPASLLDGFHFYRFWPDGRVIHRTILMTHRPTSADGDDFRARQRSNFRVGYYTVAGSQIIIELFVAEEGGTYSRRKGVLSASGIAMMDPIHRKLFTTYERVQFPKNTMVQQPDW